MLPWLYLESSAQTRSPAVCLDEVSNSISFLWNNRVSPNQLWSAFEIDMEVSGRRSHNVGVLEVWGDAAHRVSFRGPVAIGGAGGQGL